VALVVLCATAGYIDAVGLITLVGLFPAHVTGELVGLTTAFTAGHHLSHASRFAVIPTFVVALFVAAVVTRGRRRRGKSPAPALVALMASALATCAATGLFGPSAGPPEFTWLYALRESSIVAAMAFQNALRRTGLANSCPTTVMTGNLTHFVFDLVDVVAARFGRQHTEETHARAVSSLHLELVGSALGSFVLGAVLGGYLTGVLGTFSVALPLLATFVLLRRLA
jgi:uncharacterized membrane protein YoaK (UPF0700 family)